MQKIGQCQSKSGLQLEPSSLLRPHSLAGPIVFQLLASFHSNVAASTAIVVSSAGSWSIIGIDLFWLVGNFFLLPECECECECWSVRMCILLARKLTHIAGAENFRWISAFAVAGGRIQLQLKLKLLLLQLQLHRRLSNCTISCIRLRFAQCCRCRCHYRLSQQQCHQQQQQ